MTIRKILTTLALSLGALTSQAQVIFGGVSGEVQSGCVVLSPQNIPIHFDIQAGHIGRTSIQIEIICAQGLPYLITGTLNRQLTMSTGETLWLNIFSDPSHFAESQSFNTVTNRGLSMVGTGQVQTIPLWISARGRTTSSPATGPDLGQGRVFSRAGTFSGTTTIHIKF